MTDTAHAPQHDVASLSTNRDDAIAWRSFAFACQFSYKQRCSPPIARFRRLTCNVVIAAVSNGCATGENTMKQTAGSDGAADSEHALAQVLFDDANPDVIGFAQLPPQMSPAWGHEQRKLSVRWQSLDASDFSAARGERSRFVDRLAYRENMSRDEALRELSAFEANQPIGWRPDVAGEHYIDQTVATQGAAIAPAQLTPQVTAS